MFEDTKLKIFLKILEKQTFSDLLELFLFDFDNDKSRIQ